MEQDTKKCKHLFEYSYLETSGGQKTNLYLKAYLHVRFQGTISH